MTAFTKQTLASYIDHTLLKKDLKKEEIQKICDEAVQYGFYGVCIYPEYILWAADFLKGQKPVVISVIDFPEGDSSLEHKLKEVNYAIQQGAEELDMVINRKLLKEGKLQKVYQEIHQVVLTAKIPIKVIIETCELSDREKMIASVLVQTAGASYVKTSTGFKGGGATIEDVALIKGIVSKKCKIKASGKIKDLKTMLAMIQAGAERIGTSSSVMIMQEFLS